MGFNITHPYVNPLPDDPYSAAMQETLPSHWNAGHSISGLGVLTGTPPPPGFEITGTASGAVPQNNFGNGNGVGWNFTIVAVNDNGVDTSAFAPGSRLSSAFTGSYMGVAPQTDAVAVMGNIGLIGSPTDSNSRNWAAVYGLTSCGVTCGGPPQRGSFYAVAGTTTIYNNAQDLETVTGAEFECTLQAGCTAAYFHDLLIDHGPNHGAHGTLVDTAFSISSGVAFGTRHGILFSDQSGHHAVMSTGTLIGIVSNYGAPQTFAYGIDFSTCTFTTKAFAISADCYIAGDGAIGGTVFFAHDPVGGFPRTNYAGATKSYLVGNNGDIMVFQDASSTGGAEFRWRDQVNTDFVILKQGTGLDVVGAVKTSTVAVASLPAASSGNKGSRHMVSDSNAAMTAGIGAIVAAGGANIVPVYSDGTNWRIG